MARELVILPRFKRDYRNACKHAEFDAETLEYVFDALISGERLLSALREHRLGKRSKGWSGFTECHLGADLLSSIESVGVQWSCIASGRIRSCSGGRDAPSVNRCDARANPNDSRSYSSD